jgi:phage-related minor tail protein
MPTIETIRRITVQQQSTGGDAVRADLLATAAAQQKVGDAANAAAVTAEVASRRQLSAASAFDRVRSSVDNSFRAQQQLERGINTLNRALQQGSVDAGTYQRTFDLLQSKYGAAAAEARGFEQAQIAAARATIQARDAQEQAARSFQGGLNQRLGVGPSMPGADRQADFEAAVAAAGRERAALVPLAAINMQFEEAQKRANAALGAGIISQDEHTAAILRARNAETAQMNEVRKADEANARLAKGVGLSAYSWQNLSYQINDVVTSLASGISPMQVAAQQGGQIYQVLQGGQGGVKGALLGIAEQGMSVAASIGVVGAAFGTVTAAALAGVAAQQSYASTQMALTQNLSGVGRASGATAGQINAIASASAAAGNVSVRSAREMAGTFASTGKIGTEMYGGLIGSVKDYAATTGQDVPAATKALAESFADPARGADALDKQLGVLNDTTRENIQRLAMQGDRLGAQRALFDAYKTGLTSATELTSAWGRTTAAVGATISNVWDKIGGAVDQVVTGGTIEEQLARAQKVLENSRARTSGIFGTLLPGVAGSDVNTAKDEVARLQGEIQKRDQRIQQAQQNQISTRIGDLARAADPLGEQLKKISDQAKDIRDNLAKIPFDEQGAARRAMDGLVAQARQLREDMQAGGAAYADAVRAAGFQQRTVGFTPQGLSAAQINENAANKDREAQRTGGADLNARLQSIEMERVTLLQNLEKTATLEGNQIGGAFSRMSQAVQQQILSAATSNGRIPANIIAGIADKESSGNPNIGQTKVIDPRTGLPASTAYGLGQVTVGTAREAIQRGYLPPTFDRTDPSQGAAGIAGVLSMKLDQAGGDLNKAIANYYGSKSSTANQAYAADVLRRAGQMGDPSTGAQIREQDQNTRALRDQQQQVQNLTQNYGKNGLALETAAEATRRYNALLDAGVPANEALSASIKNLAAQAASAAQQAKLVQFGADAGFAREQLGRMSGEQNAYSQARSIVGDTTSPAAQMVIQQQMLNDNLKQTKDLANSAFSGMLTDLKNGVSLASVFSNLTGKIADKLLSTAADKVISGLFSGAGTSGGGGFLGGLAGLIGGGAIPRFADGGYTGSGARLQPAGIVHAGEVVWSQADVARYGGAGVVDRMRRGMPGYADGGVPMPNMSRAPLTPVPAANSNGQAPANIQIINNAPVQVEAREVVDGRGVRRQEIVVNETVAAGIRSPQGQAAMRQQQVARR